MSTSSNETFSVSIDIVLAHDESAVANMVKCFNGAPNYKYGANVIGLEAEWMSNSSVSSYDELEKHQKTRVVYMILCDEDRCFLVDFRKCPSKFPNSLLSFLRHPEFSFVGIGIKENIAKPERDYGAGCKNAVELGPLAAQVYGNPLLNGCGMDQLRSRIGLPMIQQPPFRYRNFDRNEYQHIALDLKQIGNSCANAYEYYRMGEKMFTD